MLFTMIAIVGPKTIKSEKVKFSWNNIIVMIVILFLGLGASYVETNYNIILGIKITEEVAITGLSFAALVGVILNLVLTWISNLIGKNG